MSATGKPSPAGSRRAGSPKGKGKAPRSLGRRILKWVGLFMLAGFLLGARGLRLRVRRHRHPEPQRGLRDPDDDRLLRRREDRARPVRGAEPHQHLAVGGAAARPGRGDRRGGPHLLHQQGHRPEGHPARRLQQRARQRDPGRVDDHPAVRQDLLPLLGPHHHPQGEGGVPVAEAPAHAVQERDPAGLPQHHLLRPRGLRHPGRRPGLLRQGREGPHRPRGRRARRGPELSRELRPRRRQGREGPRCSAATSTSSTGWAKRRCCPSTWPTRPPSDCRSSPSSRSRTPTAASAATC